MECAGRGARDKRGRVILSETKDLFGTKAHDFHVSEILRLAQSL